MHGKTVDFKYDIYTFLNKYNDNAVPLGNKGGPYPNGTSSYDWLAIYS